MNDNNRWPFYAAGALFVAALAFWALSRPREESAFRYDMSMPVKNEPLPGPGGALQAAPYGSLPSGTPPAAASQASEAPPSGEAVPSAYDAPLPSDELAFSDEGVPGPGPSSGGADSGGASGSSAAGASGKEFLSGVGPSGKNASSSPSGKSKTMKAGASRTALGRSGSGSAKGAGFEGAGTSGAKKGLMDMSNDLYHMTDQQVKALGSAVQKQIKRLQKAMAAEEKPFEDAMAAASSQPFQPPPAGSPPIQRGQVWPVKGGGRVSQEFGPTNWAIYGGFNYKGRYYPHFHKAMDIAAPNGTPLLALDAGKVVRAGGTQSSGVGVTLQHPEGLSTTYHHMGLGRAGPTVRVGEYVSAGQVLGYIGMTGMTTGPHVHFAATKNGTPINPREVLPKK
ncbi:MAG TPA: hypothetical protein DCM05_12050 [Elusimicrobia bacterium]|nr:hypothetical protein [Elusimicrobiota bacterium]